MRMSMSRSSTELTPLTSLKQQEEQEQEYAEEDAPFNSPEEEDIYVSAISPDKCLTCPITQEVFSDPVVAEDGHTYERQAILRWFQLGRTRSPVTNALLSGAANGDFSVRPNLAVLGLAHRHKEKRGLELLQKCEVVFWKAKEQAHVGMDYAVLDGGARIRALVDSGADLTLRSVSSRNNHCVSKEEDTQRKTAIWMLIEAQQLDLVQYLLHAIQHNSAASLTHAIVDPASGVSRTCAEAVEDILLQSFTSSDEKRKWSDLLGQIKRRQGEEEEAMHAKEQARQQVNQAHRREQRTLQRDARERETAGNQYGISGGTHGLGRMEEGYGYFPTLAALQFQEAVPPPSRSVVDDEQKIKKILDKTLMIVGGIVFIFFLIC